MVCSVIVNILGCIKYTKLYEYNENVVVMSGSTHFMNMNKLRIKGYNWEYALDKTVAVYASINHCL